jgi:hypothetical protein
MYYCFLNFRFCLSPRKSGKKGCCLSQHITSIVKDNLFCKDCYEPLCLACQPLHKAFFPLHIRRCRGAIHPMSSNNAKSISEHIKAHNALKEVEELRAQLSRGNGGNCASTSGRPCSTCDACIGSAASPFPCEACNNHFCCSKCYDDHCTAVETGKRGANNNVRICPTAFNFQAKFPLKGDQYVSLYVNIYEVIDLLISM